LLFRDRQTIEHLIDFGTVLRIQFCVPPVGPERRRRKPRDRLNSLNVRRRRRVSLEHTHIAEQRHRVMVLDPVVLGADERGDSRGRDISRHIAAPDTGRREVIENPLVVVALFFDVTRQISDELAADRIGGGSCARSASRRVHERYACSDDLMHQDEKWRHQIWKARMTPQPVQRLVQPAAGDLHPVGEYLTARLRSGWHRFSFSHAVAWSDALLTLRPA
jgi:hypothetical protein